jgi:uncharacterized membrane protein YfcA
VTLDWLAGAVVLAAAGFVMGLAGFGIGLVSLAFLPYLMEPAVAVVLVTLYAVVFAAAVFVPVRRDATPRAVVALLAGTVLGTPLGVWVLATLPAGVLRRAIGAVLVGIVILESRGLYPARLAGRGWAVAAGVAAGALGGAVGTPGPPTLLWATAQGWSARTIKANLQTFFVANQAVILLGYWWTGLLTPEVWRLAALFAVPAALGTGAGMAVFARVDQARFRRVVFALLLVSGLTLAARG